MTGVDALLTMTDRQLGVLQPRPLATLHVGGPIKADGGITANTITAGTITATNATVSGSLTANYITSTTGLYSTGRIGIAMAHTTGIATTPGGQGPFEVGVTGGGAAMMAFHRHGLFAAHFGMDTDNNFKIGGWSMGGAAYRLMDERDGSVEAAANKIVVRDASGYIRGNYINLTADVPGVAPVYVAGQNGDGYLRWYPKAL